MTLEGVRAIITGASQGFGYAVARQYLAAGAHVSICARNGSGLEAAAEKLRSEAPQGTAVFPLRADVSVRADVEALLTQAVASLGGLDVLVCNAGVFGPKGPIEDVDWDEWYRAVSINLFGAVLCCRAAIPHLRAARRGKIILLSGGGATKPMPFLSAYAASKAALVRFGETLAEELKETGIDVNAVAPGGLNTRLTEEILAAGPERVGRAFHEQARQQKMSGGTPLETGAALCEFLASPASDGITGRLLSAVWDPWQTLPQRRAELAESDIYTLRRITPEDRKRSWGKP